MIKQADIMRVRNSVGQQLGQRVILQLDKGRHRVDIQEGVIKDAYPSIFTIEVEGDSADDKPKTLSFSYTDIITKDIRMRLC